jgi:chromosome segregation ATPase
MDSGWWTGAGVAGGWIGGAVSSWLKFRGEKDTAKATTAAAQVGHDQAAFEGYKELVEDYREEIQRLHRGHDSLRADHDQCQSRLLAAETEAKSLRLQLEDMQREMNGAHRDLEDLRSDVIALRGLVVTQVMAEAERNGDPKEKP